MLAEKKKKLEALRLNILKRVFLALELLVQEIAFSDVYLFGSVTKKGGFKKTSDIDIAFDGLKGGDVIRAAARLSRALGVDVDVVSLEGCRLAGMIRKKGVRWKRKR